MKLENGFKILSRKEARLICLLGGGRYVGRELLRQYNNRYAKTFLGLLPLPLTMPSMYRTLGVLSDEGLVLAVIALGPMNGEGYIDHFQLTEYGQSMALAVQPKT